MRMGDRALTELAGRRAIAQVARAKVVEIEMLLRNARLQWRARQQLLIYKVREDALVARTVGTIPAGGDGDIDLAGGQIAGDSSATPTMSMRMRGRQCAAARSGG